MQNISSTESLSYASRQDPQGEETSYILQNSGDGNPPPGGGVDSWHSCPSLSGSKMSLNSGGVSDASTPSLCVTNDEVSSSCAEAEVVSKAVIGPSSSGHFLPQSPVGQPSGYALLQPAATSTAAGQSRESVASNSGSSPLLMYPSKSLISQLLLCSSQDSSHLRSLLQSGYGRDFAGPPESKASTKSGDELCGSRQLPMDPSGIERSRSCDHPALSSATSSYEISSDDGGKTTTGSPNSRSGCVAKTTGSSPKGGAESRGCHPAAQVVSSGSGVVQSKSGAPVRDLPRPSTAPAVHQMIAVSNSRCATNGNFLETSKDSTAKTSVGSQPDLTCVVEVTASNGAVQQVPAKVVTAIRGRELMRLSSYSTVKQPPPQCLLSAQKQAQHPNGTDRQPAKSHKQGSQKKHLPDLDHAAIATRATEMVEWLSEENRALRQELHSYYKKVNTLEKVEREIRKVSDAYEVLVLHSQKRENLEKLMRFKLETEIRNLSEINKELKEQLERNLYQLQQKEEHCAPESALQKELRRQDALIAKLIVKNRELEMQSSAQRLTLENQLKQIGMLEIALSDRQTSGCEDELDGNPMEDRSGSDLQMTLSEFQMMVDKRDAAEQRIGTKIDEDFHTQRSQQCDTDDGISSDSESPTSIHSLVRQMQEKEKRILHLEAEVEKWEQKFVDEAIFRELALEAVSAPKDGRAVSSESNLVEGARCRTRIRSEVAMQLKEAYDVNVRFAETETRLARAFILIRNLQTELAEKEMLVKLLQRHASLSRSSSISSLLLPSGSSPVHSPHHRSPTGTAYMMSMSVPASGATSRQSSQADSDQVYICASREPDQQPLHVKSNSATGILGNGYDAASIHSLELQYQPSPQVMSYGSSQSLQSASDQMKHCFWRV